MWKDYQALQLGLFLSCGCLLFTTPAVLSDKENVRVVRMMPMGPGPSHPKDPPTPKGSRKTPPPVDEDFATNCGLQKAEYPHIMCDNTGHFSEIQCMGMRCFCVNQTTGDRLNSRTFPRRESQSTNCSEVTTCPNLVGCTRVCKGGYRLNPDGCTTCKCNPQPHSTHCDSITTLINNLGCHCFCVVQGSVGDTTPMGRTRTNSRMTTACPSCDENCIPSANSTGEYCLVTQPDPCPDGTTLQAVGRNGVPQCVNDLVDASDCKPAVEMVERPGPKPKGADKRKKAGAVETVATPCMSGFVCIQVELMEYQCMAENSTSPCVMARANDPNIDCEPNGNFKPLQCSPVSDATTTVATDRTRTRTRKTRTHTSAGQQSCHCVYPANGTIVEGSEVLLGERERRPNCNRVYKDCKVPGLHQHHHRHAGPRLRTFKVRHGDSYFDSANCRSCQCSDGDPTSFCSRMGNCTVLVPDNTTNNCTLENGEVLLHSETREVGCDVCGCKDGRLKCTHQRDCEDNDNTTDPCDMCRDEPTSPVCGPDGRNHLSMCTAIYCAGIPAVDLQDGPCQSKDVCEEHPCDVGFVCIRKGAVTCMGTSGCSPDQLRTCVNVTALNCPIEVTNSGNGTESTSSNSVGEDAVCGSDNETYSSLCQLIQTTTTVSVAHSGPCEDPKCQGGEVCGSDGVTYPNSCELESLSSTRVDYPGACESGGSAELICIAVLTKGRCVVNSGNCRRLVFPQDGCCPICGGVVSVVVDRLALSEVATTNPEIQTLDTLAARMIEDEVFEGVEEKCTIEASPTDTSDLQLALTSMDDEFVELCFQKSEEVVERINTGNLPSQPASSVEVVPLPQVYEFAMAAIAARAVATSPTSTSDDGTFASTDRNGATGPACGSLLAMAVSIAAAALCVAMH